jgi:hypothetical protein
MCARARAAVRACVRNQINNRQSIIRIRDSRPFCRLFRFPHVNMGLRSEVSQLRRGVGAYNQRSLWRGDAACANALWPLNFVWL